MIRTLLVLLLFPALAHGQIIVGDSATPEKIKDARYTLALAEPKVLALNVGEFEIIEPAKTITQPLLWLSSNEATLQRIDVAANTPISLWMKRRGEASAKLHQFPAKPFAWVILVGAKQGAASVVIIRNADDPKTQAPVPVDNLAVTIGKPTPKPDDPVDPDPVIPIPGGFRVLIVRETKDLNSMPASQIAIFGSTEIRQYLNAKCVKENGQPEYRIWDKDVDISRESKVWKDAMARPRTTLPHLLVSNGKDGYEGPLPKTVEETLTILKKFGGQ